MPGQFSKANRPKLPGSYFNWEAQQAFTIPIATGSIVALTFTSDWGPANEAVLVDSYADYLAVFGDNDTPGHRAAKQVFQGEGRSVGRGGAGGVVAYRMFQGSVSSGTAGKTLNNTAGTPVPALPLKARYPGTRGNSLKVANVDHAGDSTKADLVIFDGSTEVERYTYADTDIAALAADINALSNWVTVATGSVVTGTALETTYTILSPAAFTSGVDGSSVTGTEYTAAMTALEAQRFGLFCPVELTDSTIRGSIVTWAKNLNTKGRRFMTVLGGGSSDDVAAAVARSAAINDGDFVNLGAFVVRDMTLENPSTGDPYELSSAQFAPRFAGVLAARGERLSATNARFEDLELVSGLGEDAKLTAFDGGVTTLAKDTDTVAPVIVVKSLTTYTTDDNPDKPYIIYRQPKYVRTMHGIENEFTEAQGRMLGLHTVNESTRDNLRGDMEARLQVRVDATIIQPNPTVLTDNDPPPSDDDEFVALVYGIKFGRSLEQVFNTVRVG